MKAYVTVEFPALRNPKDRKNSTIEVGEVIDGPLAKWAIDNGHGEEVPDDTPVGMQAVRATPAPAPAPTKAKAGKGKGAAAGDNGQGGEGL